MIDSNWINALKLPTKIIVGLFLACIVLLYIDSQEILELAIFGKVAKPGVIVLGVVTGALSITSLIAFFSDIVVSDRRKTLLQQRRDIKKAEYEEEVNAKKQRALNRIEYLSSRELRYLADCLNEHSQSFTTYVHSPPVSTLMSKGLVYTPGGQHHQDYYPFVIHDFVWQYLLENRDAILSRNNENIKKEEEEKRNARRSRY